MGARMLRSVFLCNPWADIALTGCICQQNFLGRARMHASARVGTKPCSRSTQTHITRTSCCLGFTARLAHCHYGVDGSKWITFTGLPAPSYAQGMLP